MSTPCGDRRQGHLPEAAIQGQAYVDIARRSERREGTAQGGRSFSVAESSSFDNAYVVMNLLSAIVASYGLLADSPR